MSATDDHAFQGLITKLRTTSGSFYALDVMSEAANRIEEDTRKIAEANRKIDAALALVLEMVDGLSYVDESTDPGAIALTTLGELEVVRATLTPNTTR
jgi:hypothetical protein